MNSILYDEKINGLFEQFYTLTGIRIALYDANYNKITSYPRGSSGFCLLLRENEEFDTLCHECDVNAFTKCQKTQRGFMYRCHLGLLEIAAPIIDNGIILGYIMLGQVTDNKNKDELAQNLTDICSKYFDSDLILKEAKHIKYKNAKQMYAAEGILGTCISHILLKKMINIPTQTLFSQIEMFIDEHLCDDLTIDRLCDEFNISRTHLYNITNKHVSTGIASFIRYKRMNHAKYLLENTKISIADVAEAVGFNDYNYFLKVFKKTYHVSPKKFVLSKTGQNK